MTECFGLVIMSHIMCYPPVVVPQQVFKIRAHCWPQIHQAVYLPLLKSLLESLLENFANSFRWVGVVVIIQLDGFWNRPFQRKGLLLNSVSWKPGRIVRGRQELGDAGQTLRTACAAHCTLYTAHTHRAWHMKRCKRNTEH